MTKTGTKYGRTLGPHKTHRRCQPGPVMDKKYNFYVEEYFKEMLRLERKRTERSRKPFLLLLIEIGKLDRKNEWTDTIRRISEVISSSTREIDIWGWYTYDSVIGIIYTEFDKVGKNVMKEKIIRNLTDVLGVEKLKKLIISCHIYPETADLENTNETGGDPKLYPDLTQSDKSGMIGLLLKRSIDILGSILGIFVFFPFFLIIPLAIKITSQGPVLFIQKRVGRFGKQFSFLKFRTMYVDNDPAIHQEYIKKFICEQQSYEDGQGGGDENRIFKIRDDPRVTPIGRLLRKSSLDELPQFFNVLKGEMSLVGPRPPIPYELEDYDIWHRRRLLECKPGITGLWQVRGRSRTTFDEMVRLDLEYISNRSLWFDIKILMQTPWAVLTCEGSH